MGTPHTQELDQELDVEFEAEVVYNIAEYLRLLSVEGSKGKRCYERVVPGAEMRIALCVRFVSVLEATVIVYDPDAEGLELEEFEGLEEFTEELEEEESCI